jgi:hypothetical protein
MIFEFLTVDFDPCPPAQAPVYFGFTCPKRTNGFVCSGLIIRDNPAGVHRDNATWHWDGNRDRPTFQPSINCKGCAHGYIENGVWRDA